MVQNVILVIQKHKLEKHYSVCENHENYVEMPKEDSKILKYNHGEKSMKFLLINYADWQFLLEKMSTSHNNPQISSSTKLNKHTPSGYPLLTQY